MWVIRGGEDDRLVDRFVDERVIAAVFPQVPDAEILTRTEIRPFIGGDLKPAALDKQVEVLSAFVREIQDGTSVLLLDPRRGEVIVGTVTSRYQFHDDPPPGDLRHRRTVDWLARHSVDDLPGPVRGVAKQRLVLEQHRDAEWSGYLAQVREGAVGRDPQNRIPLSAAAAPRRRASTTRAAPRVVKPVLTMRTCPSCFLQKHPDQFRGEYCVDCAD